MTQNQVISRLFVGGTFGNDTPRDQFGGLSCWHVQRLAASESTRPGSRHTKGFAAPTRSCMAGQVALATPKASSATTVSFAQSRWSGSAFGRVGSRTSPYAMTQTRPTSPRKRKSLTVAANSCGTAVAMPPSSKDATRAFPASDVPQPDPQKAAMQIVTSAVAAELSTPTKNNLIHLTDWRTS